MRWRSERALLLAPYGRQCRAFRAIGLPLSWTSDFSDCLSDRMYRAHARMAHLQEIEIRGGMEPDSWPWLLLDGDKAWLKSTRGYLARTAHSVQDSKR